MDDVSNFPTQSGERLLIPREFISDIIYDDDPDPPPKTPPPRGKSPSLRTVLEPV